MVDTAVTSFSRSALRGSNDASRPGWRPWEDELWGGVVNSASHSTVNKRQCDQRLPVKSGMLLQRSNVTETVLCCTNRL